MEIINCAEIRIDIFGWLKYETKKARKIKKYFLDKNAQNDMHQQIATITRTVKKDEEIPNWYIEANDTNEANFSKPNFVKTKEYKGIKKVNKDKPQDRKSLLVMVL